MITTNHIGPILEVVIDSPPVNSLSAAVRQGLATALAEARAQDSIIAVLIRGEGKGFSGGADVKEFDHALADPRLRAICDEIEAMDKVVVAAIHGFALGGGLELALACHYRIATPDAKLGLPEITLGIIPGAGGTQRLPRLIGIERAFDMILSGKAIGGNEAIAAGLVDTLAEPGALREAALAFTGQSRQPRRTGQLTIAGQADLIDTCVGRYARLLAERDAARACVTSIRNAVAMPLREGLDAENALSRELVLGAQAKALRHIFFAERGARKIDDMPAATRPRAVGSIGIIGAGTMGCGIAMCFLSAGLPVTIVETGIEALDRGVETVRSAYASSAARGRITAEQADAAIALLNPTLDFDALGRCDLIVEAAYENIELKKDIFRRLEKIAGPDAILASNTSYLDIDEIAAATSRPVDVCGMHFFSPANVMKLLEVVRGAATAPDVLLTLVEIGQRIGKVPVVARVCHGFIGNRMMTPRQRNAERLVIEGADPDRIDRIHTDFGMPMGPFQMTDLAGVDIGWHRDPKRIETLKEAFCAAGRWGLKSKAGYYDYPDGRSPRPSAEAAKIIDEYRAGSGVIAREISDDEIVARTLYVMINEGLKILEEGIAQRSSDIDTVWVHGYGWPRQTGGPMYWAQQIGFDRIGRALRRYQERLGGDFVLAEAFAA